MLSLLEAKSGVLVNGDDILFQADKGLYDVWKSVTQNFGFQLSIGKNYVHTKYLTANSTLYEVNVDSRTHQCIFGHVPFINWGLVRGCRNTGR